ncbi:hypothetical protein V2J09_022367, partial [Rumex salicifolius]
VIVQKQNPRGVHFRRAGARQRVYFEAGEVNACVVTCGGLCPGLNTVVREIVCGLNNMYGVGKVLGIDGGYRGFYSRNTITLTPKVVNDIHKRGGTTIGTSRGGHDTSKIVDSIQDRGITQVYIIGGDGTQKGAAAIYEEVRRRGLRVVVAGIPKTIDNDIPSPFYLEGKGGLFEFMERRLKENGHMVLVIAEGAGQELLTESKNEKDASGNKLLKDVDPTYMIRAVPSNASDNVYCTLLAQSAVHGAMAGYTGFTVGLVNGRYTYIPFNRITERQNKVIITDRMWARVLSSTNQPSFVKPKDYAHGKKEVELITPQMIEEQCDVNRA